MKHKIPIDVVCLTKERENEVLQFLDLLELRYTMLDGLGHLLSRRVFNPGECLMFVEWNVIRREFDATEALNSLSECPLIIFGSSDELSDEPPDWIKCRIEFPFSETSVVKFKNFIETHCTSPSHPNL